MNSATSSERGDSVQTRKRHSLTRRASEDFSVIQMSNNDVNIRARAALKLATQTRTEETVEILIDALSDSGRLVREAAALALGHMQVEEAVPKLLQLWRNDVISDVRQGSQLALKYIGSERALEAIRLTEVVESAVNTVDHSLLESFVGSECMNDIGSLERLINSGDANKRAAAAITMATLGFKHTRLTDLLLDALSDNDRLVRQAAAKSLGALKIEDAVPQLVKLWQNDFISSVRRSAEEALQSIGSDAARHAVMETGLLSRVLNTLAGKNCKTSVAELTEGLTSSDRVVREACCLGLGYLKQVSAVPVLVNTWSNDPISDVRSAASFALGQIGGVEASNAMSITNAISEEVKQLSQAKLYRAYSIHE